MRYYMGGVLTRNSYHDDILSLQYGTEDKESNATHIF